MSVNTVVMILGMVLISTIGRIYMAKHGLSRSRRENRDGGRVVGTTTPDADSARQREEIKMLKERIAVLERITTDANSTAALDREIEKLR